MLSKIPKSVKTIISHAAWRMAPAVAEALFAKAYPRLAKAVQSSEFLLIHIPKTGGISISRALYGDNFGHRTWRDWRRINPKAFEAKTKIAVIRDPVDRFTSAFYYLRGGGRNSGDKAYSRDVIGCHDLVSFVDAIASDHRFRNKALSFYHFVSQAEFVSDGVSLKVNYLIPFEVMSEDVEAICGISGLPHVNKGQKPHNKLPHQTDATIRMIYSDDARLHEFAAAHRRGDVLGSVVNSLTATR